MPSASIAIGTPSTLSLNNTCPHIDSIAGIPPGTPDPPHIGLFVGVKVVPASTGLAASGFTRKLTYGPSNLVMKSIGVVDCGSSPLNGWIEVFYLQDVISGNNAASVVNYTNRNLADTANVAVKSIEIDTITYSRVFQITPNSTQLLSFTGGAGNIFVNSAKSKYVVGFFACSVPITTATSGTQKNVNNLGSGIGNAANSSIIDIDGDTAVQLTANNGSTGNWGAIAFSIDFIMAATADATLTNYNQIGDTKSILALQSPPSNSGLINANIDFENYLDNTTLPAGFTVGTTGTIQSGTLGIQDGLARIINEGIASTNDAYLWGLYDTPANTDYVETSCIPSDNAGIVILEARTNIGSVLTTPGVRLSIFFFGQAYKNAIGGISETSISLQIVDSVGTSHLVNTWFNVPAIKGGRYKLKCGMIVNGILYPHRYQLFLNDVPMLIGSLDYFDDTNKYSYLNSGYKKCGFIEHVMGDTVTGIPGVSITDMPIKYWGMQDQYFQPGPSAVGSALASEGTASTVPVQLTTTTDAVQALVGSSGQADVVLDSYMQSGTVNCENVMTFDVLAGTAPLFGAVNATGYVGTNPSGTHTPNALDNYVVVPINYTNTVSGITYGGVAMNKLFDVVVASGFGFSIYGLAITPGAGAKTVAITGSLVDATSISYSGVGAVGIPIVATGVVAAVSQSFVNHPSCTILQAMAYNGPTTGNTFTSPTKTQRYLKAETTGVNMPMLVQEMAGIFGTVTGAATASVTPPIWGSIMVPLMGVGSIAAATNLANGYFLERAQPSSVLGDKMSSYQLMQGLTPGINTFVPAYCNIGTAGIANFQYRRCTVKPL